jgi:glycosyltransferase involved in cell wall biosynthesis
MDKDFSLMSKPAYAVISPVRNEEKYLLVAIESLRNQTLRPLIWILVNDGSSDGTARIADAAASQCDWIRVVHRADRGFREPGKGVVEAFYDGYSLLEGAAWDYVVKLDGDLTIPPDYFERCLARFEKNPRLGIGGGTICQEAGGQLHPESAVDPPFHVRGATKIYRRACWEQIGRLIPAPGWDTVDEVKANMLGWVTFTFPEIRAQHHRPAGQAQGTWKGWVKNGLANYIAGYHPVFMFCKCLRRVFCPPYVIGAAGLMAGFFKGYVWKIPQIDDRDLIRYFRRQQMRKLLRRDNLWDQKAG